MYAARYLTAGLIVAALHGCNLDFDQFKDIEEKADSRQLAPEAGLDAGDDGGHGRTQPDTDSGAGSGGADAPDNGSGGKHGNQGGHGGAAGSDEPDSDEDAGADAGDSGDTTEPVPIAKPGSACSDEAALACGGHNDVRALACASGKWILNDTCNGDTRCDTQTGTTFGTCQAIATPCIGKDPDEATCDGTERARCNADLLRLEPDACPEYAHCDAGGNAVTCTCDNGYHDNGAGGCTDSNDCSGNFCGAGGTCVDGLDTFSCNCASGYSGTGTKMCTNIDDCPGNTCGTGGTCVDGVNDYTCTCASGYSGTGTKMCTNINDCPGNTCGTGGTCVDGVNNYTCTCASGYSGTGTKMCTNVDDCPGNTCGAGGTCNDGVNNYTCTCASGYSGTGTKMCTNVNDCPGNTCGAGGTCNDGVNDYTCACASGYSGTGTKMCTNVNDCPGNTCGAGGTCNDGINNYTCTCASGYSGTGTKVCTNIDDCAGNPCGAGGTCADGVNAYSCTCASGYSGTGTMQCSDIDECAQSNVCTADYPCNNLAPFYRCRGQYAEYTPSDSPTTFATNVSQGTVTDSRTGLVWQRNLDTSTTRTWDQAKTYCAGLTTAGGGWRLPTKAELESLVDFSHSNPAIDTAVFPSTPSSYFWTISPWAGAAGSSWIIHFDVAGSGFYAVTNAIYARCVR